jgi:adenine nucleotide transporter 17
MDGITARNAFLFGALAKFFATLVTYPLQVAQSRLRFSKTHIKDSVGLRQTTRSCLMDLFREKGVAGLFLGVETKIMQTVLNSALMFLFYERILRSIHGFKGVIPVKT